MVLVVVRSSSVVKLTVALKSFGLPEENPVQLFIRILKPILINDSPFWNLNDQIGYPKGNRSELKIVRKYFFYFGSPVRDALINLINSSAQDHPCGRPSADRETEHRAGRGRWRWWLCPMAVRSACPSIVKTRFSFVVWGSDFYPDGLPNNILEWYF